jgi:hypothetical protein
MDPTMILGMLPAAVNTVVGAVPGKLETQLRKQAVAEQKRLAGGAGGMSQGALQQAQSGIANTVQAQQQQALAQLARGSAMGGGESGVRLAQQGAVLGAGQQAMQQGMSGLREQDLAYAQQQRQANQALMQQLAAMGAANRAGALQAFAPALGITPSQAQEAAGTGGAERGTYAQMVQNAADTAAARQAAQAYGNKTVNPNWVPSNAGAITYG